jgi:hypothetical protein
MLHAEGVTDFSPGLRSYPGTASDEYPNPKGVSEVLRFLKPPSGFMIGAVQVP